MSSRGCQGLAIFCISKHSLMLSLAVALMATCLCPVFSVRGDVGVLRHPQEFGKTLIVHDAGDDLSSYSALTELLSGYLKQNLTLRSSDDFSDLFCHACVAPEVSDGRREVAAESSSATPTARSMYGHDSIILLSGPPADDAVASPNATELLDFVAAGGNLFVGADPDVSDDLREVANACGLEFEARGAFLQDRQLSLSADLGVGPQDSERITDVICHPFTPIPGSSIIFSMGLELGSAERRRNNDEDNDEEEDDASAAKKFDTRSCVLLPGKGTIGMQLAEENELLTPILTGSEDAVSVTKRSADGTVLSSRQLGDRLASVVAVRARNGARLVFAGSRHMLNNSFLHPTAAPGSAPSSLPAGSYDFARSLLGWNLRQQNVFRIRACRGHTQAPESHLDMKCVDMMTSGRGNVVLALDFSIEARDSGTWVDVSPEAIDGTGISIVVTADQAGSVRRLPVERLEDVAGGAEERLPYRCNFSSLPAGWHRVQVALATPGSPINKKLAPESSLIEIDVLVEPAQSSSTSARASRAVVVASCLLAAIPPVVWMANRR